MQFARWRVQILVAEQAFVADEVVGTFHIALDATRDGVLEVLHVRQLQAAPFHLLAECNRDGMFAALLQGGGDAQHFVFVQTGQLLDAGHGRAAFGKRTGLVENDVGQAVRLLQGGDVLHEDSGAGGGAGTGHDGGGRRQTQCARTSDD